MKNKIRIGTFCAVVVAILSAILSIFVGSAKITLFDVFGAMIGKADSVTVSIILYSRIPRTLACIFAGAALAVSGAVLQNVLSNKLASPGIIGVNSGAGFGVTAASAFGAVSGIVVSASAFLGGIAAIVAITAFSYGTRASKTTVILGGVALSAIFGAMTETLTVLDRDLAAVNADFRVGGFSSVSYSRLIPACVLILAALLVLFTLTAELDVISLGDGLASGLGLPVRRYRIIFLTIAAALSAAAVSFAGLLGFVGLIIPHITRKLGFSRSLHLLSASALLGAAFVTLSDVASRLIGGAYEIPVGILMSFIGAPTFVVILVAEKGGLRRA